MLKYDDGTFKFSNSHKKILDKIKPGSIILECGCATGYMTKYMTEVLECQVYVIEHDEISCNIAMNYAVDGLCCDLMGEEWIKKFRGFKFDYILFADVLEHVYNPELVLRKAAALLKDDGKVVVSLPNIAHNDILVNLFYNDFQYTKNGLLDETHIRFYCEKNLDTLFKQAGLNITELDFNTHTNKHTEQKLKVIEDNEIFLDLLEKRQYGNVYQFIMVAQNTQYCEKNNIKKSIEKTEEKNYSCNFFVSETESFSKDRRIMGTLESEKEIKYEININDKKIKYLRIDPIEGYFSLVKDLKVICGDKELSIYSSNGKINKDFILFRTKDPQIVVELDESENNNVIVSFKVFPFVNEKLFFIIEELFEKRNSTTKFQNDIRDLNKIIQEKESYIENIEKESLLKDKNIKNIETVSLSKDKINETKDLEIKDLKNQLIIAEERYNTLINTFSWKITKPVRAIKKIFSKNK